ESAGCEPICADTLLCGVLESTAIRDVDLERLLTSIRLEVLRTALDAAGDGVEDDVLGFCSALAKQCFINEYVFATTAEEAGQAEQLRLTLAEALAQDSEIPALWPTVAASYFPLHSLPHAQSPPDRPGPPSFVRVLAQPGSG